MATENVVYIPYSKGEKASSVWCVDRGLQMFTGTTEDMASDLSSGTLDSHIFFFAELCADDNHQE